MDCSTQDLELDSDGAFNYVAGKDKIENGVLPFKLIARGTQGTILAERDVAIGLTRSAKEAGLAAPRPAKACS
jgi:hypothetical protein